ncbi:MAG TPA: S-layer homology domain-containing protein, partial [Acidimicrobiales bacterium]|nr:S-layer homology domain-containing protein [Acidimicrobiales bacterium]
VLDAIAPTDRDERLEMVSVRTRRAVAGALALGLVASVVAVVGVPPAAAEPVSRPEDPVVVTGRTLTPLFGVAPDRVAAFRREAGAWVPIPVQVDERAVVDFGSQPPANGVPGSTGTVYGTQAIGVAVLQYTDPDTWVGPDPNAAVDRNDEVALMARDAGEQALGAEPPEHVDAATGVELSITDPLEPGAQSWVYLFAHDGTLDPSAGQHLVDYDFSLASGDYKATYLRANGPNPEDSTVTTAAYVHHFSDRWVDDELHITVGGASGVDILDRHRNQFAPFECGRSEDTFSDDEGAFVVNRVGPVRAIRSYVGANSGPLSQRTHLFYEARHEILSDLRVHPIPGMMELFDYSPAAAGMAYRNSAMGADVTIDGVPDTVPTAQNYWELVQGAQGSLISVRRLTSDQQFPASARSTYYLDDATPPGDMCTGDTAAYGVSGLRLSASIANTDPRSTPSYRFRGRRVLTYRAPGATAVDARIVRRQVDTPLAVTARRLSDFPPHPFVDVDGLAAISPALDWAAHHGLVTGFAGGEFRPDVAVRRGAAVNTLWHDVDEPTATAPHDFPDVRPGAFYEDALSWAVEAGVVTGYPDGRFGPRDPVTRGQVVNLLWTTVGRPTGAPPHGFPDVAPGAFYGDALDWARDLGLVTGYPDGRYRPRDPVTRGQFVNMLFRLAGTPEGWTAFGPPPSTVRF